jgi:hypothetical protein
MKKSATYIAAAATVVVATVGVATRAEAAISMDGVPDVGEFVLYRDANCMGPLFDIREEDRSTYDGIFFIGTKQPLNNQASSVANFHPGMYVRAFDGENYTGASITMRPYNGQSDPSWCRGSLGELDDSLSSHRFIPA